MPCTPCTLPASDLLLDYDYRVTQAGTPAPGSSFGTVTLRYAERTIGGTTHKAWISDCVELHTPPPWAVDPTDRWFAFRLKCLVLPLGDPSGVLCLGRYGVVGGASSPAANQGSPDAATCEGHRLGRISDTNLSNQLQPASGACTPIVLRYGAISGGGHLFVARAP